MEINGEQVNEVVRYDQLELSPELMRAIEKKGYVQATPVQGGAIPYFMEWRDVIAKAPTGTGKTFAFGIPMVEHVDPASDAVQGLVLAPTRELAIQIMEELRDLCEFKEGVRAVVLYGGQPIEKQITQLKKKPQVVVATPGRLMDHMRHKSIDVSAVTSIVLDEADEMLNMGFYKDVRKIIDAMKARKSLCMFSATISREVMDIGWLYQRDAEEIIVQPVQASQPKITQYTLCTTGRSKLADVAQIIISGGYKRVMVFCNTKFTTATLTNQLARLNFVTDCLHGDLSQGERNKIMAAFREGKIAVLVATDVAARGIDVEDVDAVINYEVPSSNEYYTHRIGRTGRAKKEGVSYLLYDASEKKRVDELLRLTRSKATPVHWDESHTTLIEEKVDTGDKFQIRSYF